MDTRPAGLLDRLSNVAQYAGAISRKYADELVPGLLDSFSHPKSVGQVVEGLLPADPYKVAGQAIQQWHGGDRLGAVSTMASGMPQTGMFLGRGAKIADHAALAKAEEMHAAGAPREDIWNQTGWFKGVDGNWRFEIPDNQSFFFANKDAKDVGSALKHDLLYEAYPSAKELAFEWSRNPKAGYNGAFFPHPQYKQGGHIEIATTKDANSVLNHELQHYVDNFEGNAAGYDIKPVKKKRPEWGIYQENKPIPHPVLDRATYEAINGPATDAQYGNYIKVVAATNKKRDASAKKYASQEGYKRDASEVLARTTQKRLDMTAEQRQARAPWLDYDVPENMQIVRGLLGR